jgi:hypothetical protein
VVVATDAIASADVEVSAAAMVVVAVGGSAKSFAASSTAEKLGLVAASRVVASADHVVDGREALHFASRDSPGLLDDPRERAVLPRSLLLDLPKHVLWEI